MSGGFNPSDLARWALGGGANQQQDEPESTGGESDAAASSDVTPMTTEQLREQRLARMSGLQQQQASAIEPQPKTAKVNHSDDDDAEKNDGSTPMKVDAAAESCTTPPSPPKIVRPAAETKVFESPKSAKISKESTPDVQKRKQQRKNEILLKKTLAITLVGSSLSSSSTPASNDLVVDIGSTEISTGTLAEIIVEYLNKSKQPVLPHFGKAYEVAAQEAKRDKSLKELIDELQKQIVSYTATCTVEPDLFPAVSNDMPTQLVDAFLKGDLAMTTDGFYGKLVDELELQSPDTLRATVKAVVDILLKRLKQNSSILDSGVSDAFSIAAAFTKLCSKRNVAEIVCLLESFALPPSGTPEANLLVRPVMPTNSIQQFLAAAQGEYRKRSGPGLERHTILGSLLRLGLPRMSNPAFPPASVLRQSPSTVDSLARTQQQQLHTYQQTVFTFVKALVKAGPTARRKVLRWLTDAMLVNAGASALRPDSTKVSNATTLKNITVLLLNLCEPIVGDDSKQGMLHAAFCSSEIHHGGVFVATGDDAVARLGEGNQMDVDYEPKNLFVPFCFFFCARSLHFSLASSLSQHENLLRHIHHLHHEITAAGNPVHADGRFAQLISRQRADEVSLFQEDFVAPSLRFIDFLAQVMHGYSDDDLKAMPEDFCADMCSILLGVAQQKPRMLSGVKVEHVFELVVKLLSPHYASIVRNYNLRAQFGDVLYELFLPKDSDGVPSSVATSPSGGTFLLASEAARESLAPSLLLLYGEVEHTGFYEKMGYRAKIASLLKYLWDSTEHRPAFRKIAQNKDSFIKFANGIMNETNNLISTIMQKLPEIRQAQETMRNTAEWGQMSEEQQSDFTSRHEDNERNVKSSLPLCNKTLQMFGYLNTDEDIRQLFLLDELCPRLVQMLVHVLEKMVGSRGLELKVDNPEQYEFRPKEMLRDLCAIFALFSGNEKFQEECARSGCNPKLLQAAIKTCRKQNLLTGQAMDDFSQLPDAVIVKQEAVAVEEELLKDAPDEFMDALLATFMKDPIRLPSGNTVDRSTITQHLLNEQNDPFNRAPLTVDDLEPDVELKTKIESWLNERRGGQGGETVPMDVEE